MPSAGAGMRSSGGAGASFTFRFFFRTVGSTSDVRLNLSPVLRFNALVTVYSRGLWAGGTGAPCGRLRSVFAEGLQVVGVVGLLGVGSSTGTSSLAAEDGLHVELGNLLTQLLDEELTIGISRSRFLHGLEDLVITTEASLLGHANVVEADAVVAVADCEVEAVCLFSVLNLHELTDALESGLGQLDPTELPQDGREVTGRVLLVLAVDRVRVLVLDPESSEVQLSTLVLIVVELLAADARGADDVTGTATSGSISVLA